MPLVLAGATSGQATVQATDAQTVTLTLPATSGTLVTTGGAQTIEFADGSASAPSITNSGDTNTGMFFPAADTIAFSEGGTEAMRLDSSGNVGIGTSGPASRLNILGTSAAPNATTLSAATLNVQGSSTLRLLIGTDSASPFGAWLQTTDGAGAGYPISLNPLGGNVGIGTRAPVSALGLNNNLLDIVSGSGLSANIFLHGNGQISASSGFQLQSASNSDVYIWNYAGNPMIFGTSNSLSAFPSGASIEDVTCPAASAINSILFSSTVLPTPRKPSSICERLGLPNSAL
jgi:hypothetical protein